MLLFEPFVFWEGMWEEYRLGFSSLSYADGHRSFSHFPPCSSPCWLWDNWSARSGDLRGVTGMQTGSCHGEGKEAQLSFLCLLSAQLCKWKIKEKAISPPFPSPLQHSKMDSYYSRLGPWTPYISSPGVKKGLLGGGECGKDPQSLYLRIIHCLWFVFWYFNFLVLATPNFFYLLI